MVPVKECEKSSDTEKATDVNTMICITMFCPNRACLQPVRTPMSCAKTTMIP